MLRGCLRATRAAGRGRISHSTRGGWILPFLAGHITPALAIVIAVAACGTSRHAQPPGPDLDAATRPTDAGLDAAIEQEGGAADGGPCGAYPDPPHGFEIGDTVADLSLAGSDADGFWSMSDFQGLACRSEDPATVLLIVLRSASDGTHGWPALHTQMQQWWQGSYRGRGLALLAVAISDTKAGARALFEAEEAAYPWAADRMFSLGQFFPGPMIGTPAFIVIDLPEMAFVAVQEGFGGSEYTLFEPYLRPVGCAVP